MPGVGLAAVYDYAHQLVLLAVDIIEEKFILRRGAGARDTLPPLDALRRVRGHVQRPGELEEVVKLDRPVRLPVKVEPLELEDQGLR